MKGHRRNKSSSSSDGMESFLIGRKKSANKTVNPRKHANADEMASDDQSRSPANKRSRISIKLSSTKDFSKAVQLPSLATFVKKCKLFDEMARELQEGVFAISEEVREVWKKSNLD